MKSSGREPQYEGHQVSHAHYRPSGGARKLPGHLPNHPDMVRQSDQIERERDDVQRGVPDHPEADVAPETSVEAKAKVAKSRPSLEPIERGGEEHAYDAQHQPPAQGARYAAAEQPPQRSREQAHKQREPGKLGEQDKRS